MGACIWTEPGSRRRALLLEELIDVDEWCEVRGVWHRLPFPAAMTAPLVAAIERIPFRMIGKTTVLERGQAILRRAAEALPRLDALRQEDPDGCAVLGFSARGPACAHDPWRILKLHCGPGEDGKPTLIIGLGDELGCTAFDDPAALAFREPSCSVQV
jgi:hypothetical protein